MDICLPGYHRGLQAFTYHYNSRTGVWTRRANVPKALDAHFAVLMPGKEGIILTGMGITDCGCKVIYR